MSYAQCSSDQPVIRRSEWTRDVHFCQRGLFLSTWLARVDQRGKALIPFEHSMQSKCFSFYYGSLSIVERGEIRRPPLILNYQPTEASGESVCFEDVNVEWDLRLSQVSFRHQGFSLTWCRQSLWTMRWVEMWISRSLRSLIRSTEAGKSFDSTGVLHREMIENALIKACQSAALRGENESLSSSR